MQRLTDMPVGEYLYSNQRSFAPGCSFGRFQMGLNVTCLVCVATKTVILVAARSPVLFMMSNTVQLR